MKIVNNDDSKMSSFFRALSRTKRTFFIRGFCASLITTAFLCVSLLYTNQLRLSFGDQEEKYIRAMGAFESCSIKLNGDVLEEDKYFAKLSCNFNNGSANLVIIHPDSQIQIVEIAVSDSEKSLPLNIYNPRAQFLLGYCSKGTNKLISIPKIVNSE